MGSESKYDESADIAGEIGQARVGDGPGYAETDQCDKTDRIERACAGAEDAVGGMVAPDVGRLAVSALARPADEGVAVAGRVDARRVRADEHERGNRTDPRVGERRQPGAMVDKP